MFVPTQAFPFSSKTMGFFWFDEKLLLDIDKGSRGENLWFFFFPVFASISKIPSSDVLTHIDPFLSSVINFSNINIYTFKLVNKEPLGDPQFSKTVKCIRKAPVNKKNYDYLYNECDFWKTNKYFNKQSKFNHPFIKIKNIDSYSIKVFKVLGK